MLNISELKQGYLLHENNGKYILCKIIKTYSSKETAIKGLLKILK